MRKSVRELCRSDPFECALGVLCGKWKGMILFSLLGGAQRYGELRRVLLGISERTLAKQLRELCALGLVTREVDAACQSVVNYRLSAQGEALGPALRAMEAWGAAAFAATRAGTRSGITSGSNRGQTADRPLSGRLRG